MASYCTADDVLLCLAGVDLDPWREALRERGTTAEQYLEQSVIPAVSETVARWCNRPFHSVSETRWLRGSGTPRLVLGVAPVTEITDCRIYVVPDNHWFRFPADKIAYINCRDPRSGIQWREPSAREQVEQASLHVDVHRGWLIIPPTVTLYAATAVPLWARTWLRPTDDYENIMVQMTYGVPESLRPREVTEAVAALCALRVLPEVDSAITGGMRSWALGDERRSWGGGAGPRIPPTDEFWGQFVYDGAYKALADSLLARARAALEQWKLRVFWR